MFNTFGPIPGGVADGHALLDLSFYTNLGPKMGKALVEVFNPRRDIVKRVGNLPVQTGQVGRQPRRMIASAEGDKCREELPFELLGVRRGSICRWLCQSGIIHKNLVEPENRMPYKNHFCFLSVVR